MNKQPKPLPSANTESAPFLVKKFMETIQSGTEIDIQRQVDNRYRLFYGAVFNLMNEYFITGFTPRNMKDGFDLSFDHTDCSFQFYIAPRLYSSAGMEMDMVESYNIVDKFREDLREIHDDHFCEACSLTIYSDPDDISGQRLYEFKFSDTKELLNFACVLYKRINGVVYDESVRYMDTVIEGIESSSPRPPALTRIPSIEYIEATLQHAQGRGESKEAGAFYHPSYTN